MINLDTKENRVALIRGIHSETNKARKQLSLKQFEVQNGRMFQYVKEDLLKQYSSNTVRETPIVSSINVQRKISKKKATVYSYDVDRSFSDLTDEAQETAKLIYRDMKANKKFSGMNKSFIYQEQSIGMIVPKNKKLICRVFKMHQIDAIPSIDDPETADGFIISAMDTYNYIQQDYFKDETATGYRPISEQSTAYYTGKDSPIADKYDYKNYTNRFLVWTRKHNFIMDQNGDIIDPETGEVNNSIDIESPFLKNGFNLIPFFEVAQDKDFDYFVRPSNSLCDFTIQFNSRLSDESNVIKMNGYSVAILKAPESMTPQNLVIGPAMLLHLKTDNPDVDVDFQFAAPQSNIGEISAANDKLLNYYITTEEVDGDEINSSGKGRTYTSGLDRFIAITDRMSSNKDTYEEFKCMEMDVWNIIKHWLIILNDTDLLDDKYKIPGINLESEVAVKYGLPEMIQSEDEKIGVMEKRINLEIMSKIEAIMKDRGVDRDMAIKIYKQIVDDDMILIETRPEEPTPINQSVNETEELDEEDEDIEE